MRQTYGFAMNRTINVIDAMCGAGKTSWAIQHINDTKKIGFGADEQDEQKFIYVTPYLNEVDRIIDSTGVNFFQPEPGEQNKKKKKARSKSEHFKNLILAGNSIVTTHELFKRLDAEALSYIEEEGYVLIMDEVANVLNQVNISENDIRTLQKAETIEIDEKGKVLWLDEQYEDRDDRFRDIKIMAENENLYVLGKQAFYWTMNVQAFEAFDEVYILTYLFDAQIQKYYYNMFDVTYNKYSVKKNESTERYELIDYDSTLENRMAIYELLKIYEDYTAENGRKSILNSNYDGRTKMTKRQKDSLMSTTWFKNAGDKQIKQVNNNVRNYFENQVPETHNKNVFWTTKKDFAPVLKNKKAKFSKKDDRSKDNFVSLTMRATNDYADCTSMAYVYNRFMNPNDKKFFTSREIKVDEDLLAVSDLIQLMFRGCIRKGEPMYCYIPAERMRNLLKKWAYNEI